ncbi:hypothetical protein OK016_25570 [Vibrio chagasii]|nr:hypothetical protein [Vibrio chagasii]
MIDSTDYQVGQDNVSKWGMDVHNTVFVASVGFISSLHHQFFLHCLLTSKIDHQGCPNASDFLFMWGANIMLFCCYKYAHLR